MTNTQMTEFLYELFKEQTANWTLTLDIAFYGVAYPHNTGVGHVYPVITRKDGNLQISNTSGESPKANISGTVYAVISSVTIHSFAWI